MPQVIALKFANPAIFGYNGKKWILCFDKTLFPNGKQHRRCKAMAW